MSAEEVGECSHEFGGVAAGVRGSPVVVARIRRAVMATTSAA
ncbi:hypothetical protein ACWC0C_45145 [Streptomyces sp. NPDC001709]